MQASTEPLHETRLAHLPVTFFSTVMGLTGLAIAWQKAHAALGAPALVLQGIAPFAGIVLIYGSKVIANR